MPETDPRVDEYIAAAAPFAQPILKHLRKVMHAGCPDVRETIKWSFPHFDYKGVLAGMAAFKQHCSFGFWKASLIFDSDPNEERDGMGHFGRITKISDLPSEKVLIGYVKKAAVLNDAGVKPPRRVKPRKTSVPLKVPADLAAALKLNKKARATFEDLSYTHKKEYLDWLTEAKRVATREERFSKTMDLLAEGKTRHWKYQRR
jgi:uncharacterized protein YdeI (YjbR/CyaY-like superfamily)